MQTKGAHIIQKLVVEVNTSTTQQGYAIKDNARSFIDQFVIPAIESYLAEIELFIDDDQVVQIDQLAIEIGTKNTELNSPELTFIIQQAFEKKLSGSTIELAQFNYLKEQEQNKSTVNQLTKQKQSKNDELLEKESLQLMTGTSHKIKALFYFLEFGTRPWWSKDAAQFNELLQEEKVLEYISEELPLFTRLFLKKVANKRTKQRLILQFSDIVLAELVKFIATPLAKREQKEIDRFNDTLKDLKWFNELGYVSRQQFWEFVIEYVVQFSLGKIISDEVSFVQLQKILVKELGTTIEHKERTNIAQHPINVIHWLHLLTNLAKPIHYYDALFTTILQSSVPKVIDQATLNSDSELENKVQKDGDELKQQSLELQQSEKEQPTSEEINEAIVEMLPNKLADESELLVEPTIQNEKLDLIENLEIDEIEVDEIVQLEILDGLFVDNAGLILIHPFLKHFFKQVGLLSEDEKSFTDPLLAVHLLHFIATGKEQDFEHTLLFEKYLVGLPFEEIVPRNIPISDELKSEVVSLLDAVKENWEPLRTTSIEGLQETFLVRSGKLMNLNEHPRLVIERKTVDILLEKIEWSMSLVHFPWMEKLLYVEW